MSDVSWSPGQEKALRDVAEWYRSESATKQVFHLFGYAGTGKTRLAKTIDEDLTNGSAQFMAPTAKASQVLRSKGCDNADTVHSQIYQPKEKSKQKLRDLEALRDKLTSEREHNTIYKKDFYDKEIAKLDLAISYENKSANRPAFSVNLLAEIRDRPLIILDECSMIDERVGEDILSFGVPVLVLGDPAQLPPVMGAGFFTAKRPEVMLTEIHRQAKNNPIIAMATIVREGGSLKPGSYGSSRVIAKAQLNAEDITGVDQLLVGRNATRRGCNQRLRKLNGIEGIFPQMGERLVCLRNNRELGFWNGGIYRTTEEAHDNGDSLWLNFENVDEPDPKFQAYAHRGHFLGEDIPWYEKKEREEFDYGYALTVHKSQGSQWGEVAILDEWHVRDSRAQWLYTGITRAAEKLLVVQYA